MNKYDIINYLKQEIALLIHQPVETIADEQNFIKLGISSIDTLKLVNKIQKKFDIEINPIAMFEYKTIVQFSNYLNECIEQLQEV